MTKHLETLIIPAFQNSNPLGKEATDGANKLISKYIAGHTDVIAGCVTTKSMKHWERLKLQQFTTGSALSPFDAALVARGLKTLPLRVDKICSNAQAVAQFLAKHPKVHRVSYPGLESHPTHEAGKKYMKNWSGMIGFDVGTAANAIKVAETVRLIVHAVSLGGTESLMEHPLSMSHGSELLREETEPMVPPGLLRLRQRVKRKSVDALNSFDSAALEISAYY
ncbi:cystathionine beta-lyase domain protein [Ancylostoma ceylanicum]|uniref:Cystathionine beta-lyase domain protein n=1 Tax=Ancylostoma ceylanicum TaxID=53326 RepID=A0A0D6LBC2_9BILA|nr:cystathionine beta-lyase domain protein [Ancylostoma ceylanicum]